MNQGSHFSGWRGDVACIDVVVRDLPTFALIRGSGSVMVWGGISRGFKTPLVVIAGNLTAVQYRDEILQPQQDNARPHVARVCSDFLAANNIVPLDWPVYSPDVTPIEHLWDHMDGKVMNRANPPMTFAQLRDALEHSNEECECLDRFHDPERQGSYRCTGWSNTVLVRPVDSYRD